MLARPYPGDDAAAPGVSPWSPSSAIAVALEYLFPFPHDLRRILLDQTQKRLSIGMMTVLALTAGIASTPVPAAAASGSQADAPAATVPLPAFPLRGMEKEAGPSDPTQGDLGRPYILPAAPRARMHECGIEWHEMKMSGAAVDKTWRVFAAGCLADKNPADKNPADKSLATKPSDKKLLDKNLADKGVTVTDDRSSKTNKAVDAKAADDGKQQIAPPPAVPGR